MVADIKGQAIGIHTKPATNEDEDEEDLFQPHYQNHQVNHEQHDDGHFQPDHRAVVLVVFQQLIQFVEQIGRASCRERV